eukprot:4397673-Ditylum_brightwellii.AAC.1
MGQPAKSGLQEECLEFRSLGELCEFQFQRLHGHMGIPSGNRNLFQWISEQRLEYCKKELGEYTTMIDEKEKQLNEIGFQWK